MNAEYGAGNWILIGFEWNQGEQDSGDPSNYESDEYALFNAYRSDYGTDFLFVSSGVKDQTGINAAKINNATKSNEFYYYSNDDLIFSSDNLHYDNPMGERYYNIFKNYQQ